MTGRGFVLCEDPADDAGAFRSAYARYLAGCCREFLTLDSEIPLPLRAAYARVAARVRRALTVDEGLVLHCFASPTVGTALRCARLRTELPAFQARIDVAVAGMMPHLLLEMALRGLLDDAEAVVWAHGAPRLASLAIGGEFVPPDDATGLTFSSSRITALAEGIEIERLPLDPEGMRAACEVPGGFTFVPGYHPLADDVTQLATVDHNPIAAFETHPNKDGNAIGLGDRSEEEWIAGLDAAFTLVATFLPRTFAEMRLMLQQVVPVGCDAERHLSASYREAIGTMYLTLHPNVMTMTEAVVHEFQHNKFNVAADGIDFLSNAFHPLYPSPVRPDPRPLWGILLAVHAFLPVAELYRRMRDAGHPLAATPGFDDRLSDIDLKNHEGMEMLRAHAQFTPPGVALFAELEALEQRHLSERTARGLPTTPTEVHLA